MARLPTRAFGQGFRLAGRPSQAHLGRRTYGVADRTWVLTKGSKAYVLGNHSRRRNGPVQPAFGGTEGKQEPKRPALWEKNFLCLRRDKSAPP